MKIATYFDVSLDYLLGRDEKEKPTPEDEGDSYSPKEKQIIERYRSKPELQPAIDVLLDLKE